MIQATRSSTEVAYIAPDASLWFFWVANGTTAWHEEEVSGPGTVWGGLAMTHSDSGIQIAAPGPGGSIMFFWAADGTNTWHAEQVAGPGTMQGAPAMVAGNYTMEIAVTLPTTACATTGPMTALPPGTEPRSHPRAPPPPPPP